MSNKKTEKFLFNTNIFDEPDIEEEEEIVIPPPPTFSEDELETVRRTTHDRAYEQGKKDGVDHERTSREEAVAQVLKRIEQQASLLFAAEHERERIFETEVLRTTLSIFEKLFPDYTQRTGFEELQSAIHHILQKQDNQSEIVIEVNADIRDGINDFITSLSLLGNTRQRFDIRANQAMSAGQCAMYWKDGGAIRNNEKLAGEIRTFIQDTLAGTLANLHDGTNMTDDLSGGLMDSSSPAPLGNEPEDQGRTINMEQTDE